MNDTFSVAVAVFSLLGLKLRLKTETNKKAGYKLNCAPLFLFINHEFYFNQRGSPILLSINVWF